MAMLSEIQQYTNIISKHFSEAFVSDDKEGMYETSYALTRAYALSGNISLAGRWANECEKYTEDPSKLFAINLFLLYGIIKQKYCQKS